MQVKIVLSILFSLTSSKVTKVFCPQISLYQITQASFEHLAYPNLTSSLFYRYSAFLPFIKIELRARRHSTYYSFVQGKSRSSNFKFDFSLMFFWNLYPWIEAYFSPSSKRHISKVLFLKIIRIYHERERLFSKLKDFQKPDLNWLRLRLKLKKVNALLSALSGKDCRCQDKSFKLNTTD